jgi:hypothetical protein
LEDFDNFAGTGALGVLDIVNHKEELILEFRCSKRGK